MTWVETDGTRSRILRAALALFAVQGYQRTSLRQIAERLQLTKAAILYHFPSKGHLLTALAEPMVRDLETLVETAGALSPEQARWTLLEGWVDTMLEHRGPLGMLFHDLALVERGSTYHRLVRVAMRANEIVAGPDADRRERVRAVQAIAMCSDPVVFLMDVPAPVLRVDMLDGVRRLLGGGRDRRPARHRQRRQPTRYPRPDRCGNQRAGTGRCAEPIPGRHPAIGTHRSTAARTSTGDDLRAGARRPPDARGRHSFGRRDRRRVRRVPGDRLPLSRLSTG